MLEFQRFDPATCQFPRPRAALLPLLAWPDLALGSSETMATALTAGAGVRHFSRGRYALGAAYRAAGVGATGVLLAPAYHCRTMLDPALALGGAIHFYSLNSDFTPHIATIRAALAAPRHAIKALVVPHYFGFEQPAASMGEMAQLCREHGVMLIEDCSHSWIVAMQRAGQSQAATGHMVVASPYKFFACCDGGILWGNPAQLAGAPSRPRLSAEVRAIVTALQQCLAGAPSAIGDGAALPALTGGPRGEELVESSAQPSSLYSHALEATASLAVSRWVMRRTKINLAIQRRRDNYRMWVRAVACLPGARALFPELPVDCAPYMFPLYISAPDPQFFALKQAGVPIWRWDEMAVSDCCVAAEYRLHLLHLPCHQSLSARQMQWMTDTVAKVLA